MVGANLKAETLALMEKRASLEAEMNAIIEILCGPGGPGISGNLVDAEGFPRSDIDIPAVRSQRHRLAAASSLHDTTSQASPMDEGPVHRIPFAIIDEISDASPAAEDGLQLGDMIVKFGNVESGDSLHSRLALEAQSNEGHPVPLQIMRQGSLLNLTVTPKQWHGRGLLGCHFRML
ncbi:26S proteasome regulatory complex subunit PSMD9 protein [Dioscorea alata]|uniref:26S proteasome regulatory complex subunit PSMD9 protein n=1 Tax=Dioscorea alata TaxID=55571 RepID=A0ACB7VLM8_DIOAL|nr:26S proteasome regulatory complex subunit PSMD9 protein [Dioscorea alata]